jgi:aquaporin Z
MIRALREHWPEYLLEASELGIYMISAGFFTALLQYPGSPVRQAIENDLLRRALIGVAMGLTGVCLVYSPLGKRSGAHMNPAVTLAFLRLGKVKLWDAMYYVFAQFIGGTGGILIAAVLMHGVLADPSVHYVVTVPGAAGGWIAFAAEFTIAFGLMLTVLFVSNTPGWSKWTGLCSGLLVAVYIALEAPLSGMSMNPARTFGSALTASLWTGLWIYFLAPTLGMQLAAQIYLSCKLPIYCAKLCHPDDGGCIFRCEYSKLLKQSSAIAARKNHA